MQCLSSKEQFNQNNDSNENPNVTKKTHNKQEEGGKHSGSFCLIGRMDAR